MNRKMCSTLIFVFVFFSVTLLVSGQQAPIQFSLLEEQPAFTYIGNVGDESKIETNLTQSEINRLRFQILPQGNAHASLFKINELTGRLESAVKVDRENVCQPTPNCILGLDIAVFLQDEADPSKLTDLLKVIPVGIEILDMNDNSPMFPEQTIRVEFPESSSVGDEILTSTAADDDSGYQNSVQTYEIIGSDGTFGLRVLRNLDGSQNLAIVLNKTVDRETKHLYQLTIVAKDGGNPPRSGSLAVDVKIGDYNDNKPLFTKSPYNVTLPENEPIGNVVLKVSATDDDAGENARVTYKFASNVPDVFVLNSTSGEISLQGALDYERETGYAIVVEAEDHGSPPLATQVMVNVKLLDVNDNAPQININLPPGGADVFEDANVGLYIANVMVSDKDSGENGTVTCESESSKFILVKFSREIYKINLHSRLDREKQEVHNVTVVCSDNGNPKQTNKTFFTINVRDINDNFPIFNQTQYNVSIAENNRVDDDIFTVHADDKDAGANGAVSYKIIDHTELFSIQQDTGVITADVVFDRENVTDFRFRVVASDNGMSPFMSTATVMVHILDKNDHEPRFYEDEYFFSVQENQHLSTVIGNVTAYDADTGPNGAFTFTLDERYEDFFHIDSLGNIRSKVILDREVVYEYSFNIYVKDRGIPSKSSSARVVIRIKDENDNPPVIFYPSSSNNTINLKLNTVPGSQLATVVANDSDQGINSFLIYSIIQGNVNSMFRIQNKTGQITLQKDLVEKDAGTYTLVLAVQDGGVPQRATWTNLVIVIGQQADSKNLIIVIAVCSVTLFISFALIVTICIVRRHDNQEIQERRVHFENQNKNFFMEWLKCFSAPSKKSSSGRAMKVKDTNRQANQIPDADTKPIIVPGCGDSAASDDSLNRKKLDKPELVRMDSGIAELSGGSTSPPQSYRSDINDNNIPEIDLASSYPGTFTFVDNKINTPTAMTGSQPSLNNSIWHERSHIPPPQPYHRYVSMDEQVLHSPSQKQKIYFARFRSSSESESMQKDNYTELSGVSPGNSLKQLNNLHNLNNTYSGPFYLTNSLERGVRSHYAHPRNHFCQNQSRSAMRRELPTIRATPEPYDPLQELNAISYQENDVYTSHSVASGSDYTQGQITHPDQQNPFSHNSQSAPYDLSAEEKIFNRDVIV